MGGKKSFQRQIDCGSHITAGKVTVAAAAAAAAVSCSAVHSSGPVGVSLSNLHHPHHYYYLAIELSNHRLRWLEHVTLADLVLITSRKLRHRGGGNKAGTAR